MHKEIFAVLASRGLSLDEAVAITDRVVKEAAMLDPAAIVNAVGPYAFLGAAAVPLAGYKAGQYAAKLLDAGSSDIPTLQVEELASQIRSQIAELRAKKELKQRKQLVESV